MRIPRLLSVPLAALSTAALAQSVLLPAPRLLTTMPMGAKIGSTVEVTITSEEGDGCTDLVFSSPKVTAQPKKNDKGEIEPNRFLVTVASDAQPGIVEARLFAKLGMSSARAFSINALDEVTRKEANTSLEKAILLPPKTICNATTTTKAHGMTVRTIHTMCMSERRKFSIQVIKQVPLFFSRAHQRMR